MKANRRMSGAETILSPAKLNLGLQVLRRRQDGYHDIHSVFLPLSFGDSLSLSIRSSRDLKITVQMKPPLEIPEQQNLIVQAARAFHEATGISFDLIVDVQKRIPPGTGLGGGSSNAATVLRWLNEQAGRPLSMEELQKLAQDLGSDVPFFLTVAPRTIARVDGRGEQVVLRQWEFPFIIVLVIPPIEVSTRSAYQALSLPDTPSQPKNFLNVLRGYWDCERKLRQEIVNDFESLVFRWYPQLQEIKTLLLQRGAAFAGLSGTGSTIYGCFWDEATAKKVASTISNATVVVTQQLGQVMVEE